MPFYGKKGAQFPPHISFPIAGIGVSNGFPSLMALLKSRGATKKVISVLPIGGGIGITIGPLITTYLMKDDGKSLVYYYIECSVVFNGDVSASIIQNAKKLRKNVEFELKLGIHWKNPKFYLSRRFRTLLSSLTSIICQ